MRTRVTTDALTDARAAPRRPPATRSGAVLLGRDRPSGRGGDLARAALIHDLQRIRGNRVVVRSLQRKDATYSGTVYLPGSRHAGHAYKLEGTKIVEQQGKQKVTVGTIATDGGYTLVDAEGTAIPGETGKVGDLVGSVTRKGGTAPGQLGKSSGSGSFRLTLADGGERSFTVKDGGVYLVAGKQSTLAGRIDAGGRYELKVGDEHLQGSLAALPPGHAKVKLTQRAGGKVVEQLQIGQDAISEGVVYFDDAKYTVKGGKLFRDGEKSAAGELVAIRSGSGPKAKLSSIRYRYTDAAGKEVSGDLMSGRFATKPRTVGGITVAAGEGSALKLGKRALDRVRGRHVGGSARDQEGLPDVRRRAPQGQAGGAQDGREAHDHRRRDLHLQAVAEVESSGFTQCINTWDSDVVSFGFKQYTMAGKLQDLIKRVPTAFARYGIELSGRLRIKQGVTADGIKGVNAASELRGAYWATKFFQAGLDDEIIVAQAAKALEDLGAFETKTATQSATSTHMRSAKVRAILFELDNNGPAYVRAVVRRTLAQANKKPDLTEAEFIEILGAEMEAEYVTYRSDHGNGATDEKARQKAKNIVAKTQRAFDSTPRARLVEDGLEGDQRAADRAHGRGVEQRPSRARARQPGGQEPVGADQSQAGPLRQRERRRGLDPAGRGEQEVDGREAGAEHDRERRLGERPHWCAVTRLRVRVSVPTISL